MNIIEKLGLEKCKAIVDGAPEWARAYNTKMETYASGAWFYHEILLSDLKAQIDQHYYGQSEEKELEQYAVISQEKIEGGALLVGDFAVIQEQLQTDLNLEDKLCKNLEDSCIKAYKAGQQSMQAKIDELQKQVDQLNQWNSNQYQLIKCNESETQSLKHLLQKLIDDDHTTMRPSMAYEIQKALRGEHE